MTTGKNVKSPAAGLDRVLAIFERKRDPRPLAAFRVVFYAAVIFHFLPSFIFYSESYSPDAFRVDAWNTWLYSTMPTWPDGLLPALAALTGFACFLGLIGIGGIPGRFAAAIAGLGLFAFESFNSLHTYGVMLTDVWAVCLIWAFFDDTRIRRPLVVFQFVAGLFFMGFHMVLTGWLWLNPAHFLLSSPEGTLVRDWVANSDLAHAPGLGLVVSLAIPLIAMGAPVLIAFGRTRLAGVVLVELLLAALFSFLRVQPLFYVLYASGALLALDDSLLLAPFTARPRTA
jgi:hypothetical protein